MTMRIEKHITDLMGLLSDIRKEPSPAVVGFIYSTACLHMFKIVFDKYLDPGMTVKHNDFRAKRNAEKLKSRIPDFEKKEELFNVWKEMEDMRNELCYGYPSGEDIKRYVDKFKIIEEILEDFWGHKFSLDYLRSLGGNKNE